jgi:hypothetical protein
VIETVADGGATEDTDPVIFARSFNHFHDPLTPDWTLAGFNWVVPPVTNLYIIASPFLYNGRYYHTSSAVWAQKHSQSLLYGNYSWPDARDYFYNALIANNEDQRNSNFAECFRAVGQLMHLVQDASVPAHTRNDGHVLFMYEQWLEKIRSNEPAKFNQWVNASTLPVTALSNISLEATVPIQSLFDNDSYLGNNPGVTPFNSAGLAEYCNANFFSEDTIFKNYRYPAKTSVTEMDSTIQVQGVSAQRPYLYKTADGDTGYPLATVGFLKDYVHKYFPLYTYAADYLYEYLGVKATPALDGRCYEEYASRLIPRAVAYSGALLNYFFRGQVEAVNPTTTKDGSGNVTGVKMKVRNKTPKVGGGTGAMETIGGGDESKNNLIVSYQYTSGTQTTYGKSGPLTFNNYSGHQYEFTGFTSPIPANATDPKYILTYRGKLGAEDDAVAAKSFVPADIIDDWENGQGWTSDDTRATLSLASSGQYEGSGALKIDIVAGSVLPTLFYGRGGGNVP